MLGEFAKDRTEFTVHSIEQMTARRRRIPSESNSVPLIINPEGFSQNYYIDISAHHHNGSKSVLNNSASLKEDDPKMPRDRTAEFVSAVRSLQGRQIMRATSVRDVKKVKMLQSYGEFMMVAKSIGKNIASTYTKLEKLTLLVKRKSLFDDRPAEIQELSYIIKEDLKGINEQLARLQNISKTQNISQRNGHKHLLSHSNSVVVSLQSKFGSMSNEFKQVLEMRSQNLKHAKDRRDHFTETSTASAPESSSNLTPFRQDNNSLLLSTNEVAVMDDATSYGSSLLPVNSQHQKHMLMTYDHTDNYLQSRVDTIHNIESTIVELGGIFQQLAHMVKEQDEIVERIDTNIIDAEMNVEAAHHQILRYFQSVTSNRWLMMKIFAVIMFFFTFFAIFLA